MANPNLVLKSNGLNIAEDFPVTSYEVIFEIVNSSPRDPKLYEHFAGAWNAIAYRFQAVVDHGSSFSALIAKHGSTPPPEQRYVQEKTLFDFYSAGFSTFEATFYGLYSIGAFISPAQFPLTSERDQQRVSPASTKEAFTRAFQSDSILTTFRTVFEDPEYQKWREIRNVLTHRTAPGRRIYVSIGTDDAPPTEWKLNNSPLDASIASNGRRELVRVLGYLLADSADFVKRTIQKSE